MSSTDSLFVSVSVLGGLTLALGLRGLITRRPVLVSSRWSVVIMALWLAPVFGPDLFSPSGDDDLFGTFWLSSLMFLGLLVVWVQSSGYSADGVTLSSFRQALLAALERMTLPYEESLTSIRLPTLEVDLQVGVGMGIGQIRVQQRRHAALLRRIAREMNAFYRSSPVKTSQLSWFTSAAFGALVCIAAAVAWMKM